MSAVQPADSYAFASATDALERLIRDVPDFPQPGVLFKDIGPVLADADGLRIIIEALSERAHSLGVDKVAGIEARGFLLAAPVGVAAGLGVVPVRKAGKLPGPTHRIEYALEYATATLEIQTGAVAPGERVLLIDDVLATGGTARAAAALLETSGAVVPEFAVLIEIAALGGRGVLGELPVRSLLTV